MKGNRYGSVSFGTETREYFGILSAEIARAVPESVINCIACIIFQAHRTGRKEANTFPIRRACDLPVGRCPSMTAF